jgi:hypothetical protein
MATSFDDDADDDSSAVNCGKAGLGGRGAEPANSDALSVKKAA